MLITKNFLRFKLISLFAFIYPLNLIFAQETELFKKADKNLQLMIENNNTNVKEKGCHYGKDELKKLEEIGFPAGRMFIAFSSYGTPETISGTCVKIPIDKKIKGGVNKEDAGKIFLLSYPDAFMIDLQKTNFHLIKSKNVNNFQILSYQQYFEGLEVENAEFTVSLNEDFDVTFFRGTIIPYINFPSSLPFLYLEEVIEIVNKKIGVVEEILDFNLKYIQHFKGSIPAVYLVYQLKVKISGGWKKLIVNVDAFTGEILSVFKKGVDIGIDRRINDGRFSEGIDCEAIGGDKLTGRLILSDFDGCCSREGGVCGGCGSNPVCSSLCYPQCNYNSQCIDEINAKEGLNRIYNFWKDYYERLSWDGNDKPMQVTVRSSYCPCAGWDANEDGDNNEDCRRVWMNSKSKSALDIMSHEFTHAMAISGEKRWQSILSQFEDIESKEKPPQGDYQDIYVETRKTWHISEHVADCQGKIIDNSNWAIGDQSQIGGCCNCTTYPGCCTLRRLDNPSQSCKRKNPLNNDYTCVWDLQPDTWNNYNDFTNKADDYHFNAGIGNKACYLLGYDPAGTQHIHGGITITSKGRIATGKTYYYAIDTPYFFPNYESYDTYRTAMENAAQYYDAKYPGSGMYYEIINTMDAIGIWKSDGTLPRGTYSDYRSSAVNNGLPNYPYCRTIYLFYTKQTTREIYFIYYPYERGCQEPFKWYGPYYAGDTTLDGPYGLEVSTNESIIYYNKNNRIYHMRLLNRSCCSLLGTIPSSPQVIYGPATAMLGDYHWIFYVEQSTNRLKYRDRDGNYNHNLYTQTYYSPAAVMVNNRVFIIYVGTDNKIYYKSNDLTGVINNTNWVSGVLSTQYPDDFEPITNKAPSIGGPWMSYGDAIGVYVMFKNIPGAGARPREGIVLLTFDLRPNGELRNISRGVMQNEGYEDAGAVATGAILPIKNYKLWMFYADNNPSGKIRGKFKRGR